MEIRPAIWREFNLPARATMGDLHEVLQVVMGWEDAHLHQFIHGDDTYGPVEQGDGESDWMDENSVVVSDFFAKKGDKLFYEYDFGDGWTHKVTCKAILPDEPAVAVLKGERACPPEDCGGGYGYEHLKAVLLDPQYEEHEELKEWLSEDHDFEAYDLNGVNKILARMTKRAKRRKK